MSDDATEDDLTGICERCGKETETYLFSGWAGKAEVCGDCGPDAAMEE